MTGRRFNQMTTFEERVAERVRQAREDVEKMPPSKERDGLVQKISEIEAALQLNEYVQRCQPYRE